MRKLLIKLLLLGLLGCGEKVFEAPVSLYEGSLGIFLEHDMLCEGQSSKIHAVQLNPWKEIPLDEVIFNPLGEGNGTISASGEYATPNIISEQRIIKINGKFKNGAPGSLTGEIMIFPKGLFPGTGVKPINYQLGISRSYGILDNGDLIFGSSSNMMHASLPSTQELIRVSPEGKLIWRVDTSPLHIGGIWLANGKIFSIGSSVDDLGNTKARKAIIFDQDGGVIREFPLPYQEYNMVFAGIISGISYFLFKDYEEKINLIVAMDDNGETLYEKSFSVNIEQIQITSRGDLIGMARIGENQLSNQALFTLDPTLENYTVVYEEKLEWPYAVDIFHLLPNNQLGLFKLIDQKSLGDTQWVVDILNFDGSVVFKNKVIHRSTPGVNQNTEPFLNNVKERDLDQITNILIAKNKEVFVAGLSFNQTHAFIEIVNMNNGNHWYFPLKPIGGLGVYPVSFIEYEGMVIYTLDNGGKVYSFILDRNLNFDPCAYPPYWN